MKPIAILLGSLALSMSPFVASAQTCGPVLYAEDGTYLGRLSSNPHDYESIGNPHGPYGSPHSATSIRNKYGTYGSEYSPQSPTNRSSTQGPRIIDPCTGESKGRLSANPDGRVDTTPLSPLPLASFPARPSVNIIVVPRRGLVVPTTPLVGPDTLVQEVPAPLSWQERQRARLMEAVMEADVEKRRLEVRLLQQAVDRNDQSRTGYQDVPAVAIPTPQPALSVPVRTAVSPRSSAPAYLPTTAAEPSNNSACHADGVSFEPAVMPKAAGAYAWSNPERAVQPVARLEGILLLRSVRRAGEWLVVSFEDASRNGRSAYVRCSEIEVFRP